MRYNGRLGTAVAAALAALSHSSLASADPPTWTDRRLVLESVAGFGTPVGSLGAILRIDPIAWLSVGGGVGVSFAGVEYAGILLGRLPLKAGPEGLAALTLGGSYSVGGTYQHNPNPSCWLEDCRDRWVSSRYQLADAHWLGVELGAEFRSRHGLSLRGFAGLAKLMNPGDVKCDNYDRESRRWLPGPCKAPLPDAPSSGDLFPDISGPPGTPDVIWVLGLAVGYAIDPIP